MRIITFCLLGLTILCAAGSAPGQNASRKTETPKTAEKPAVKEPAAPKSDKPAEPVVEAPAGPFELTDRRAVGSTDMIEVLLEAVGDTKQITPEQKQVSEKMKVVAGFRYEERVVDFQLGEKPTLKSLREYSLAKARMNIGDVSKTPELDQNHKLIVCEIDGDGTTLFSPKGPLKSEQLLLLEGMHGNTLSLDLLLPNKPVRIGDTWKIPDHALKSFLIVDAVAEQTLEATLTSVADDLAMVEIVGDSQGAYLGAYTEISVQAKYQFDFRTGRINWLGMLIEENRAIGHVGPGLDLKARLQVKISPLPAPQNLNDELLDGLDLEPVPTTISLRYDGGAGPWRFEHPRSWYIFQDEKNTTLLRMLGGGELVAQCNIVTMPSVDAKSLTSLQRFSDDLKQGLGKSFGTLVLQEESVNAAGYTEYRVVLDGKVKEMPFRWVYYLLTDKLGNQCVVVFVIHAEKLELFEDSDERILDSFRMTNETALPKL